MIRWFLSRTLRHSVHMRRHVRKLLNAQRDLLKPEAIGHVEEALGQQKQTETSTLDKQTLEAGMRELESVAERHLKPYPFAGTRENIEVLLVAIAVAMGIRTFFLQPFKIPTGSMQPTLYGITETNLIGKANVEMPSRWNPARFLDFWFNGVGYTHVVAQSSGKLVLLDDKPKRFLLFNIMQRLQIGDQIHKIWFPPDGLWKRAGFLNQHGLPLQKTFRKGEDVIKLRVVSGDHLFVDRFTYNFRRPRRGEIVVFETRGIPGIRDQDLFYIKRLVAMGEETVSIDHTRHLVVDGKRLDSSDPHFELLYAFDQAKDEPAYSVYSGHTHWTLDSAGHRAYSPFFRNEQAEYTVRPDHYLVMGDNTLYSFDSRFWRDFPRRNVIGKSFFVYWPIGTQPDRMGRFGWSHR